MSINAAELLARIKKRKQELNAAKPNPYIADEKAIPQAKRKAVLGSTNLVNKVDAVENELALKPIIPLPVSQLLIESTNVDSKVWVPKHIERQQIYTLPLTAKEKQRKQKLDKLKAKEEAEKQKELGIGAKDQPKLTVHNVAAVMGAEYLKDPTKYEMLAQQEMQQRRDMHDKMNAERKLSPDEKWTKTYTKIMQSRQTKLHCLITRISISSRTKAVLNSNIAELCGTGVLLTTGSSALIILEAGERECNSILKLINKLDPKHQLLWRGQTKKPKFQKWTAHCPKDLKQFLSNYDLESVYWLDKDSTHY